LSRDEKKTIGLFFRLLHGRRKKSLVGAWLEEIQLVFFFFFLKNNQPISKKKSSFFWIVAGSFFLVRASQHQLREGFFFFFFRFRFFVLPSWKGEKRGVGQKKGQSLSVIKSCQGKDTHLSFAGKGSESSFLDCFREGVATPLCENHS
jgi:hypothetical protein